MQSIEGIKEIIDKYEVFILDQWGVMHDGNKGYSHAIRCINYLKVNNKKLIIFPLFSLVKLFFSKFPVQFLEVKT